jgi:hypothetical protein
MFSCGEHFLLSTTLVCNNIIKFVFGPAMFLLYHSEGCNSCGGLFRKCYINDLHNTTCSGMLVTAAGIRAIALTLGWKPSKGVEPVGV